MSAFTLMSCEIEDDGPDNVQVLAEVVDADLPEAFEVGKVYNIDVTYVLPDSCHDGLGLQAVRGALDGAARRDIYVAGVASKPAGEGECNEPDGNLQRESTFSLRIDEDETYTFYLWIGVDEEGESLYNEIEVPVMDNLPSNAG